MNKLQLLKGNLYKKYQTDAGWDVESTIDIVLKPFVPVKIPTGLILAIPKGCKGAICPRSSTSSKGLLVFDGTVDPDYRGEVHINIINLTNKDYFINKGDRIAQLAIYLCLVEDYIKVDSLPDTDRGTNGFGSTGK